MLQKLADLSEIYGNGLSKMKLAFNELGKYCKYQPVSQSLPVCPVLHLHT